MYEVTIMELLRCGYCAIFKDKELLSLPLSLCLMILQRQHSIRNILTLNRICCYKEFIFEQNDVLKNFAVVMNAVLKRSDYISKENRYLNICSTAVLQNMVQRFVLQHTAILALIFVYL